MEYCPVSTYYLYTRKKAGYFDHRAIGLSFFDKELPNKIHKSVFFP